MAESDIATYKQAFDAALAELDKLVPGHVADAEEFIKTLLWLNYVKFHYPTSERKEIDMTNEATVDETVGLREALDRVMHELGVPTADETPAPVANAWYIADAALKGHRFDFGDEEHASNQGDGIEVDNDGNWRVREPEPSSEPPTS